VAGLGTTGRIILELTTCWSIVLAATGIYLWWPPKANQLWGVWLPRLRQKPYLVLRDLHAVSGIYVAIVAILIALTGLIYTSIWGSWSESSSWHACRNGELSLVAPVLISFSSLRWSDSRPTRALVHRPFLQYFEAATVIAARSLTLRGEKG
jgi:uncharacterized iron-regulated membrane protein